MEGHLEKTGNLCTKSQPSPPFLEVSPQAPLLPWQTVDFHSSHSAKSGWFSRFGWNLGKWCGFLLDYPDVLNPNETTNFHDFCKGRKNELQFPVELEWMRNKQIAVGKKHIHDLSSKHTAPTKNEHITNQYKSSLTAWCTFPRFKQNVTSR